MGGGLESKLVSLLEEKKHKEALELWFDNPALQDSIDPNAHIGNDYGGTPLHCAAKNGSKPLLWLLLNKGGDPFVRNAKGETPIHVVCTSSKHDSITNAIQADLLEVLLTKIPEVTGDDTYDIVSVDGQTDSAKKECEDNLNLGVVDKNRNTPLHMAAASGLITCVEILLAHGAPLHVRNMAGQTPCDMAVQARQLIIAKLLESRMVLRHQSSSKVLSNDKQREKWIQNSEALEALQVDIVAKISVKLKIHQSEAEALLQAYGWSEELVLTTWENDRAAARISAGLVGASTPRYKKSTSVTEYECIVCFDSCHGEVLVPCEHHVCQECLISHVELQIREGGGNQIRCPETGCYQIVPNGTIKLLVSNEMYETYSRLKLQNFVACYSGTQYCPSSGCDTVVALPEAIVTSLKAVGPRQGVNVECSNGHRFCWTCSQEPHEPCSCELWERWKGIVGGTETSHTTTDVEWITKCTKSCPHCRIRIEKNEGCNHMTCMKCRHEFCWICLTPWSEHGDQTGGYFSCNRYKQQARARELLQKEEDVLKNELEVAKLVLSHYQDRYENHLISYSIESELARTAAQKGRELATMKMNLERNVAMVVERMPTLHKDAGASSSTAAGLGDISEDNFLPKVTAVLLNARQVLAASYALGFFIPDSRAEDKETHEALQNNLEDSVERLSQMVNRPYLCTPHSVMVVAARDVDCVCEVYLQTMKKHSLSLMVPPPSSNPTSISAEMSRSSTPLPSPPLYTELLYASL